jgi:hypothetical protein
MGMGGMALGMMGRGMGGPNMASMSSPGGGMMGGMGPMGGMGGMMGGGPGGMMSPNDQPPNYTSMPQMPPRYSGLAGPNPYANYSASPSSSTSSTIAPPEPRTSRRTPGAAERIPLGAYAKAVHSPKVKRSYTEPTTADRLNRKVGPSGKEWIKGDDFLDACTCTTNCTCRDGHRVLYRSKDESPYGDSDTEAQYRQGEIRYILKKDLGRDCGDHSGCKAKKADDSDDEEKVNKKEKKKKEEKKRKEQFEGFKEDMLEALDERFEALKKERSKAESVRSSPRQAFAGFGASPFGMGGQTPGAGMGGQMPPGLGGGQMGGSMPPGIPVNMASNPYAAGMPGGMTRIPGMGINPLGGSRGMGPGQMPRTMFDDEMSISDMGGGAGPGISYTGGRKRGGMHQPYANPPGRRDPDGMLMDERAPYYAQLRGPGPSILRKERGQPPRDRGRGQRPKRFDDASDDSDLSPRPTGGRRGNADRRARFDNMGGKSTNLCHMSARSYFMTGARLDELDDDSPQRPRPHRVSPPRRTNPKHQAAYESDDDDEL